MSFKREFNNKGFSLIELLTASAITATLAVIGIKSYQGQVNQARMVEAQRSLSYVYSNEKIFYNTWATYHTNLMIVGASPTGLYKYDVGFNQKGRKTGGNLGKFPEEMKSLLEPIECSTFASICKGHCLTASKTAVGRTYTKGPYDLKLEAGSPACTVRSRQTISACSATACSADVEATASGFKAIAIEKLKHLDVWSINQKQEVKHDKDGSS